jgi:hypothetical protein
MGLLDAVAVLFACTSLVSRTKKGLSFALAGLPNLVENQLL